MICIFQGKDILIREVRQAVNTGNKKRRNKKKKIQKNRKIVCRVDPEEPPRSVKDQRKQVRLTETKLQRLKELTTEMQQLTNEASNDIQDIYCHMYFHC